MTTTLRKFREILTGTGGSQIAEAALIFPLLFMILLAIMSFGRAYNVYSTIARAAQDGATIAATTTCASCGAPTAAAETTKVVTAVTSAMKASHVATDQIISFTPAPAPVACPGVLPAGGCATDGATNITVCRNIELNRTSTGPKQCGTIVSFQYPYQFSIPFASINLQSIHLTAVAERQMEN